MLLLKEQIKVKYQMVYFTHVVKCYMRPFQLEYYSKIKEKEIDDSLDREVHLLLLILFSLV